MSTRVRSAAIVRPPRTGSIGCRRWRIAGPTVSRQRTGCPCRTGMCLSMPCRARWNPPPRLPVLSRADAPVLMGRSALRTGRAETVGATVPVTGPSTTSDPAWPRAPAADRAYAAAQAASIDASHHAGHAGARTQPQRAAPSPQQFTERSRSPARPRRFPELRAGGARVIVARATGGACRCGVLRFYSRHHTTEGSTTA